MYLKNNHPRPIADFCCYLLLTSTSQSGAKINISDGSCPERIVTVTDNFYSFYINSIILLLTIFYQLCINSTILFCLCYDMSGDRQHRVHLQGLHPHLQQVRRGQFFATKHNIESIFTHNFCHIFSRMFLWSGWLRFNLYQRWWVNLN